MHGFLFRPKWIGFHLVVVVAIVAMVNFGLWQFRRLDERRDFNAVVEARYDAPLVPLADLLVPGADPEDLAWRPVTVSGTYLPDETILVVNRFQNGRAGMNVVVPLDVGDGRTVLVNRGFVPLADDSIPPIPATEVFVAGRLRPAEERGFGQLSDPADGELREVQRVDIDRLAPQLPGEVAPMYVDAATTDPPEVGPFPEPVIAPDLSEGNHLSYAIQWFIFSVAVAAGWVLAVRRSIRARRRDLTTGGEPDVSADRGVRAQPSS